MRVVDIVRLQSQLSVEAVVLGTESVVWRQSAANGGQTRQGFREQLRVVGLSVQKNIRKISSNCQFRQIPNLKPIKGLDSVQTLNYPLSQGVKDASEQHHGQPLLLLSGAALAAPTRASIVTAATLIVVGQDLSNTATIIIKVLISAVHSIRERTRVYSMAAYDRETKRGTDVHVNRVFFYLYIL